MRNYLLLEIVELVKRLGTRGMTVAFAWVKGHAKIQGNERVDTLAEAAITTGVEESRLSENDHIRTFKQQLQT
jgi:ribonuclease HI